MSLSSPHPAPRPLARRAPSRPARPRPARLRWGWIETVTVCLVLFPALTFIPALRPVRILLRVGQYGIGLVAWGAVLSSGRARQSPSFPARPWMVFCSVWLVLQVFNPMGDLPLAAPAEVLLNLAILSPIFWAPRLADSTERVNRMMRLLFACNLASLLVGFLQFQYPGQVVNEREYVPGRFDPPVIQAVEMSSDPATWQSLMIERADGRRVFRPCGLTDAPGGACMAASICCLIAMTWVVSVRSLGKRVLLMGVAVLGMAMLYFCQVRVIYLITLGGVVLLGVSLFLRRDFRGLTVLSTIGLVIFLAALAWAVRSGGDALLKRFSALTESSAATVYEKNRGAFLEDVFNRLIWDYPLGAGLGHWGMINQYFGHPQTSQYSEIQLSAWVYDGGIPLMIAYAVAGLMAIWNVFRISLRAPDPEFAKSACTVVSMSAGIYVSGLSGMPFIGPGGLQFWLMLGVILGAAARPKASGRGRAVARGRP